MKETYKRFLDDILKNLIDRAIDLASEEGEFNKGVQFGYYEAVSHILNQADIFEIYEDLNDYVKEVNLEEVLRGTALNPAEWAKSKSSSND